MMLRVNDSYLDYDGDIFIDRQSKLFEEIDATTGDFSYGFELPWTQNNLNILGLPYPDNAAKIIYNNVFCDIIDTDGLPYYTGKLRVERLNTGSSIECSFFSGNYNWLSLITGKVTDLDFSEYDIELTRNNIVNSMPNTEGINFPLIDTGALITRSFPVLMIEDFNGCMYVKTIMTKIANSVGLKFSGELINNPEYDKLVVCKNTRNQKQVDDRSCFVQKTTSQPSPLGGPEDLITWDDDSNFPYFDGALNNFDLGSGSYTADVAMTIQGEVQLVYNMPAGTEVAYFVIKVNGSPVNSIPYDKLVSGVDETFTARFFLKLQAGDVLDFYTITSGLGASDGTLVEGTIKLTPQFIFNLLGISTVPNWTKQEFVSNILNLFNVVSDYDPIAKEVTFNFFDGIKGKTPIDLSTYISSVDWDYEEFISSFARTNVLTYQEGEDEELRSYNVSQFIKYGQGTIEVENDFIEEKKTIIESEFTAPISYINGVFDMSMERVNIFNLEQGDDVDFTSVTSVLNHARFNIPNNPFIVGDLLRITDSTDPAYNGDWTVSTVSSTFVFCFGLEFSTNATGKLTKLNYKYTDKEDVFIFQNVPFIPITDFSGLDRIWYSENTNTYTNISLAFFNMLNTNRQINDDYLQGLSFGEVDNVLSYQKTLTESYWSNVDTILNDPVKGIATCKLPKSVFMAMTPLSPAYISTIHTNNQYYINRIRGYKDSATECIVELIKL